MNFHSTKRRSTAAGFSLLEILAATVVATILLTLALQILGDSGTAVKDADKKRNATTQLRTALDRFAADFSSAMLTAGGTAIWNQSDAGTEIGFISGSRSSGTGTVPRGAVIGYALLDHEESGIEPYKELKRGDGPVDFNGDLKEVFKKIGADPDDSIWTGWEPIGVGIVRFHVGFLLDDGTITQTPPAYSMISPQGTGYVSFMNGLTLKSTDHVAIAFSERNKQQPGVVGGNSANDNRYVKALIVAAACVDRDVLKLAVGNDKISEVDKLGIPKDGETPLEVWEKNLTQIEFLPLLRNIRFQQRTIPVP
jgi:type II secretory pathway pseudopilin PulG